MEKTEQQDDPTKIDEAESVVAYLRAHRNFFLEHPELLVELDIPHDEGEGSISLIEKQVSVLRERNEAEQQQLYSLVQTARDNERVAERLHRIAVEVLGFENLDDILDSASLLIKDLFNVEFVSFRITNGIGNRPEMADARSPAFADLYHRVVAGHSVCDNNLTPTSKSFLFGEDAEVKSVVLVPLGGSRPCGVLALGSLQDGRFSADHGTFYLDRLGELLGAAIYRLSNAKR